MKHKLILIAGLMGLVFVFGSAKASIVTIEIEGAVDLVDDGLNHLEGLITKGMTFTGSYTYNSDTPDSLPDDSIKGVYSYYTQPYGISLNINGIEFKTDPLNVDFAIDIINNRQSSPADLYVIESGNNLSLGNGTGVDYIAWQLKDNTFSALSNDFLPLYAPILSDWDSNYIYIAGPLCDDYTIGAIVTSAVLIPEPTSLSIFLLGTILMRNRFFKS